MINPKDFLPDLETDLSTDQITDSVEIYRDKWGIPHIVAKNEHDLFFAQGFSIAQDRLFQMEMIRRLAKGELSEILGQNFLKSDKFFRTIGIRRLAKEYANKINVKNKAHRIALSYIDGINHFIETQPCHPES